jgi:hypothetical protein
MTSTTDPPSTSSHIRQEQIDQLRSRVDSVLRNLVQSTEVETQTLKTQVHSLRDGPGNIADDSTRSIGGLGSVGAVEKLIAASSVSSSSSSSSSSTTTRLVEKQWIVDPYGDQGEFEGELNASNLPHGTGVMKYSDGRVYNGEWKDGRWHGKGRAAFSNGDVFDGMYCEDQRHGLGIYQWNDGREFTGGFVNDQRSGQGEYTWPDGAKYSGEFDKGLRHGEGTYTVRRMKENGVKLLLLNQRSCVSMCWLTSESFLFMVMIGCVQFSDGSFYKGSWKQGKYHGKGEVGLMRVEVLEFRPWIT